MKPRDKTSALTVERLREVLSYDARSGIFVWRRLPHKSASNIKIGDIAGSLENTGYIRIRFDGHRYLAHRLAWLYVHGAWPYGELDHKDRNRKNNQLSNLREASPVQNRANRNAKVDNSNGRLGVSIHTKGVYQARMQRSGRIFRLGLYKTIEEAAAAYKKASVEFDGEFSP